MRFTPLAPASTWEGCGRMSMPASTPPVLAMLPTPDTEDAAAFVDTLSRLIGAKTAQAAAGPRE